MNATEELKLKLKYPIQDAAALGSGHSLRVLKLTANTILVELKNQNAIENHTRVSLGVLFFAGLQKKKKLI
ncbi:unnamed protein product [Ceratitis capitata]|uniref:(Mediterranean fruit fly) hypothetical protein n=1 Tax=Ceratitis capitata TaxID=7213 RepID=A0A811V5M8_CERCA|nr:unnamed protein product [Ceratitis capitata]